LGHFVVPRVSVR